MRAMQIINGEKPLEAREYPDPDPEGEEVLLRVEAAGVCHSDVHIWDGHFDLGDGKQISLESRCVHLPFTMGHEIGGEVAALDPHASGVKVGERLSPIRGSAAANVRSAGTVRNYFASLHAPSARGAPAATARMSLCRKATTCCRMMASGRGLSRHTPARHYRLLGAQEDAQPPGCRRPPKRSRRAWRGSHPEPAKALIMKASPGNLHFVRTAQRRASQLGMPAGVGAAQARAQQPAVRTRARSCWHGRASANQSAPHR